MHGLRLGRHALGACAGALMLAACGGRFQTVAPGAMPAADTFSTHARPHAKSWMLREATSENLLYVASTGDVYVYSYPGGGLVGTLTGIASPQDMCSDQKGNVWITSDSGGYDKPGEILEYAHGGTKAIATLSDSETPTDCSVDPTTGNLAVANSFYWTEGLAVYPNATGSPSYYSTKPVWGPYTVTYDNKGNIFVQGTQDYYTYKMVWLPKGASQTANFKRHPFVSPKSGVQWDGNDIAIASNQTNFYQYTLHHHKGKQVGHTTLYTDGVDRIWIQGSTLIGTSYQASGDVFYWSYPGGGSPSQTIDVGHALTGVTVSLAQ